MLPPDAASPATPPPPARPVRRKILPPLDHIPWPEQRVDYPTPRLSAAEQEAAAALQAADAYPKVRPQTRADCQPGGWNAARPCPFVGCKHHLCLEVASTGSIKYRMTIEQFLDGKQPSCSLDGAERGGTTLETAGTILGMTRERVRQIETRGLKRIRVSDEDFTPTLRNTPRGSGPVQLQAEEEEPDDAEV